jgi:hypothetical protein
VNLLVLDNSKQVEKTNKKQGHGAHNDQNERKTMEPHTSSTETSFLRSHFIAQHCNDLYIGTINRFVQFIGLAITEDGINQLIIFKSI